MAKTHLATKWADLLCDIYVENAAHKVAHRKKLASRQRLAQRRLDTKIEQLKRTRDADVGTVERQLGTKVRQEQDRQKWLAVLLPPIPPLVVAFFVYFRRRAQEREGVAKTRLR